MDAILLAEALYVLEDLDGRLLAGGKRADMDAFRHDARDALSADLGASGLFK